MKTLCLILLMPLAAFAGNGDKTKKVNVTITTGKNGKVEITGLENGELKELQQDLNDALKNVTIKIDDGKKQHQIHFKAEIKTD